MSTEPPLHIFVLIDALGWAVLEGHDFLNSSLPYRFPLKTVLGFSSGAIPTILTGLPPSDTGHWNLFYYDPKNSPFRWLRYFSWLPDSWLDNRYSRRLMKELGRRVLGLGPAFECNVTPHLLHYFNWVEKKDIYSPGGIMKTSFFDLLVRERIPYKAYSYHHFRDVDILASAKKDIAEGKARVLFLYLAEMDAFLHKHRLAPELLEAPLRTYANELEEIYSAARERDPNTVMAIFSDHGMAPVRNHHDLMKDVDGTGHAAPKDYLVVYDSTMARFWFFNEAARRDIGSVLANSPCGRVIEDDELRDLGIYFPDRRFGEVIFLLHPGWMLAKSDFNGPRWNPDGMHGYHPDDPDSDSAFMTNRAPSFRMRTIADIHRFMTESLGLAQSRAASEQVTHTRG